MSILFKYLWNSTFEYPPKTQQYRLCWPIKTTQTTVITLEPLESHALSIDLTLTWLKEYWITQTHWLDKVGLLLFSLSSAPGAAPFHLTLQQPNSWLNQSVLPQFTRPLMKYPDLTWLYVTLIIVNFPGINELLQPLSYNGSHLGVKSARVKSEIEIITDSDP